MVTLSRGGRLVTFLALCGTLVLAPRVSPVSPAWAQTARGGAPNAMVAAGEGGPTQIVGTGTYSYGFTGLIYDQPDVVLIDRSGLFVDHNPDFLAARRGQILGRFTSNFNAPPFHYAVTLPPVPHGLLRDVAHDGKAGVEVFSLTVTENFLHDAYLERGEQGQSLLESVATPLIRPTEVVSGTLLVYAPDSGERFPAGFGPDGKLFTADDPLVTLPQGYTVVHLKPSGFTFDRSRTATIDVSEARIYTKESFSRLSYTAAFNALIDLLKKRYAYTAFRHINWEAERATYGPLIARAQATGDAAAYYRALLEFTIALHDLHTSAQGPSGLQASALAPLVAPFVASVGLYATELDNGQVVATYVIPGSAADRAGIIAGAQLLAIDGRPIRAVIAAVPDVTYSATPAYRRLIKVALSVRFPANSHPLIAYRDEGAPVQTKRLTATVLPRTATESPAPEPPLTAATYSGYGYATWRTFEQPHRTLALWEAWIRRMIATKTPGIILDLRANGGGSGQQAALMASYLFSVRAPYVDHTVTSQYDPEQGKFVAYPQSRQGLYAPAPGLTYRGKVVVLVGPGCASACEFFAYWLKHSGRASVIGQYPTAGAGGAVNTLSMPAGVTLSFTWVRVVNSQGQPIIEARGVAPTIRVPVTLDNVLAQASGQDPILDAALAYLRH